jgi:hypothetical protein
MANLLGPGWPKEKFKLVLRIYAPRGAPPSNPDGTWTRPAVKRVQQLGRQ